MTPGPIACIVKGSFVFSLTPYLGENQTLIQGSQGEDSAFFWLLPSPKRIHWPGILRDERAGKSNELM
jgi:hypothetical protein